MSGVNEPEVEEDPISGGENDGVQAVGGWKRPVGSDPAPEDPGGGQYRSSWGGEEGQQMIGEMAVGLATAQLTAVSERVKSENSKRKGNRADAEGAAANIACGGGK